MKFSGSHVIYWLCVFACHLSHKSIYVIKLTVSNAPCTVPDTVRALEKWQQLLLLYIARPSKGCRLKPQAKKGGFSHYKCKKCLEGILFSLKPTPE